MWYTPLAFQKYEVKEEANSERELEILKESLQQTRRLLQYAAVMRCLPIEIAKQKIHWRYRSFSYLNQ